MKKLFLENLATKAMALLLAVLTWVYLFTQGNGTEQIDVEFQPPAFDSAVYASVTFKDSQGRKLDPGGPLPIRLSGPRGDVRTLKLRPPLTFACKFPVDPKLLAAPRGTLPINLEHAYFGLPGTIQVEPIPSSQITLEYVKYLDREVDLETPPWDGDPREGYKVDSILILPARVKAKVPADLELKPDEKIPVRRIPVAGRFESFTLERWELEPGHRVSIQTPFRAEVKIAAVPATRRLPLDLVLAVKEENKAFVKLQTKSITVELQGPKELIDGAPPSAFAAFVLVTDADAATPGPKNINLPQIGCHILDPKYARVAVVLMPDLAVENRQVKITVEKK